MININKLSSRIFLMILSGIMYFGVYAVYAQPYYMASPQGYGAGTTGGGTPTASNTITVSTASALKSALTGNKSIILVSGRINNVKIRATITNKTILGLPGARLVNLDQTKGGSGILIFGEGSKNVIIRNLIFEGPAAYDVDGSDLITNTNCTNLWVDHCEFLDGVDGAFDNTRDADDITVSWCKFSYVRPPRAGGPGGADDHRFANLIGNSETAQPRDGLYSTTWMYNWWSNGVKSRMVRARSAEVHMVNNYWNSDAARIYIGLTAGVNGASCYVENGVFAGTGRPAQIASGTSIRFDNCINGGRNAGSVRRPSYAIDKISPQEVVSAVTNTSCGAGATLQVSPTGQVSSPCMGAASITKRGSGSSKQTVDVNQAIENFRYTWENATTVTVEGMPPGINVNIDNGKKEVSISGAPTVTGTYNFEVRTVGGNPNAKKTGRITVRQNVITTIFIQENASGFCGVEGRIENEHSGYTGAGFANTDNSLNKGIEWSVNIPTTGSYSLVWRYANGTDSNRPARLKIDGQTAVTTINMGGTGAWTDWRSTSKHSVQLSAGINILRLEAKQSSGLANIDRIEISGAAPKAVNCSGLNRIGNEASSIAFIEGGISVHPNPVTSGVVNIQLENGQPGEDVIANFFDLQGRKVVSYAFKAVQGLHAPINLLSGTYILRINTSSVKYVRKVVIN